MNWISKSSFLAKRGARLKEDPIESAYDKIYLLLGLILPSPSLLKVTEDVTYTSFRQLVKYKKESNVFM